MSGVANYNQLCLYIVYQYWPETTVMSVMNSRMSGQCSYTIPITVTKLLTVNWGTKFISWYCVHLATKITPTPCTKDNPHIWHQTSPPHLAPKITPRVNTTLLIWPPHVWHFNCVVYCTVSILANKWVTERETKQIYNDSNRPSNIQYMSLDTNNKQHKPINSEKRDLTVVKDNNPITYLYKWERKYSNPVSFLSL